MTSEEKLYALLGAIVCQWNYAEHCARQILRQQINGGHLEDPQHLSISKRKPQQIEVELRDRLLPGWAGAPGEPFLKMLADAFPNARDYRNYYVHGAWTAMGTDPAYLVIIPSKPHQNKVLAPQHVEAADLIPIADHLAKLGAFAQRVGVEFGSDGQRRTNADGSLIISSLALDLTALPPFPYQPLIS